MNFCQTKCVFQERVSRYVRFGLGKLAGRLRREVICGNTRVTYATVLDTSNNSRIKEVFSRATGLFMS